MVKGNKGNFYSASEFIGAYYMHSTVYRAKPFLKNEVLLKLNYLVYIKIHAKYFLDTASIYLSSKMTEW